MTLPPLTPLRQTDTHRLIPSQYISTGERTSRHGGSPERANAPTVAPPGASLLCAFTEESVLTRIADNDQHLTNLVELDRATNETTWAENDHLPGIGSRELIFGVPNYRVINACFVHAHPLGSRFNSSERGAWYAGFELETSQAEIIFHKTQQYAEIDRFDDTVFYDDYLADFSGQFHDIRKAPEFTSCLDPDSYVTSQQLAERVVNAMSLGIVYPSVRRSGGTCIGCFRPAAVTNVRKHDRFSFTWTGNLVPEVKRTTNIF